MVVAALVWLAASSSLAQEAARSHPEELPLSVETVGLEPTVAKTGDLVTAAYRVRFKDLIAEGKEILVLEDRMEPDKLPLAPFEGVALEVRKRRVGDEHIWDFVYHLRIVAPAKGAQVLRSVTFYWLIRDLGQKIEDARVLQAETDPLPFYYVTTITDEPVLDVRDAIELGAFAGRAVVFRTVAWVVAPLPLALWVLGLVAALRRPKPAARPKLAEEPDEVEAALPASPTIRQARRNLRRHLRERGDLTLSDNGRGPGDLDRELVLSLRDYLMAEVPDLNAGDTAREIKRHVEESLGGGSRKETLSALAAYLVTYQNALERGAPVPATDPAADAREIEALLQRLEWRARVVDRLKKSLGGS